ncbi:MurR/RpiR family transcriptional regulator [Lederbergia sp. NSJ-179]|uniref:MurR/RpiR family transcriptional regulator n=1 Tax=Lederbergia sp. NSJ-179 TaxID=2931402 RepID=UPI001FD5C5C0|nr:MurR/RpiR family transcriptional regulator [Lederbergia sp. NSJ-179]MCJ7843103.1 MurR/RpiR family transcriptional regulator [Lederbergia sp. NSJ-179]
MIEKLNSEMLSANAIQQIRGMYKGLRKSEQKVADYLLQNTERVINSSISEIAKESNVSEATVIRFCKAVGFMGFHDLKLALARNMVESESPKIFENISKNDALDTAIQKIFANNIFALNETLQSLDLDQLNRVATLLSTARIIYLYGLGTSGIVAEYASYRFTRMGLITKEYVDSHSIAMSTATVKSQDLVLLISQSGSTKEIVEALKEVKQQGAPTIAVTGYPRSPIAIESDIVLQNAIHEAPFESGGMPSLLAQLGVIDAMMVGVALEHFDESIEMIRATAEAVKLKKY